MENQESDRDRGQDPIVARLRPDPAQPAVRTTTLRGFLGDSELDGHRRIYFTRTLDYYAEFRNDDVLQIRSIPADQSPFPGEEASVVDLLPGVRVNYVRARITAETAPFELDIQPASSRFWGTEEPGFTDSVISPSCDIFDTSCTGAGCGDPNPAPTVLDCPVPPRRRR
ncbi:hypothetical protein HH310_11475 [Actinoplanes sp. TBRC 11911]|uniref:hypothetical protein n=1 Tax=Actinoplanes sp. TBRC 11911 TaxID=2729386 RepID=UPI00145CFCEB|nr:hypothetical protein [Actinoplanes sp. TBRC 11911]NMO51811.1 hypothetical protein [Actinoplanes sp. TBRC 11911]